VYRARQNLVQDFFRRAATPYLSGREIFAFWRLYPM
jgi:hypothetical protein